MFYSLFSFLPWNKYVICQQSDISLLWRHAFFARRENKLVVFFFARELAGRQEASSFVKSDDRVCWYLEDFSYKNSILRQCEKGSTSWKIIVIVYSWKMINNSLLLRSSRLSAVDWQTRTRHVIHFIYSVLEYVSTWLSKLLIVEK